MTGIWEGMLYAYAACFSFALLYNLRGRRLFLTTLGSAFSWGLYLLLEDRIHPLILTFLCMTVVATYAEIMAVVDKCPMTVYLVVGFLPFVPGAGLYYTMKYLVEGDIPAFFSKGLHTLGTALAMGVAVAVVLYGFNTIQRIKRFAAELKERSGRRKAEKSGAVTSGKSGSAR